MTSNSTRQIVAVDFARRGVHWTLANRVQVFAVDRDPHVSSARLRLIALGLLIVALAVAAVLLPLHQIQDAIADTGAWAPAAAVVIGALLLCALVPRTAISFAAAASLAAGGRIVHHFSAPAAWTLADRAGNRICIAAWPDGFGE
jgi:hypothetical protein